MLKVSKIVCISLLLLELSDGLAQNFVPDDASWTVKSRNQLSAGPGYVVTYCIDEHTYVLGDTIAEGVVYQKVRVDAFSIPFNSDYITYDEKENGFMTYAENKLFYGTSTDSINLLYDFTLEQGDPFAVNYRVNGNSVVDTLFVTTVDSIKINNSFRKRLKLRGLDWSFCGIQEFEWVEGIGDINLGLLYHNVEFQICPRLTTAKGGGEEWVNASLKYNPCSSKPHIPSETNVYPNPFTDYLRVDYHKNDEPFFSIVDLSGRVVFEGIMYQGANNFQLSTLYQGVYILEIKNSEGIKKRIVKH